MNEFYGFWRYICDMQEVDKLKEMWLTHGYGEREFEEACKVYNPNNPKSYTCKIDFWVPLFERLYRDSKAFRSWVKMEQFGSE
jgi:hypothetical protein